MLMGTVGGVRVRSGIQGKQDRKGASLPGGAFDLDPSAMGLGDRAGDAESQTGTALAVRTGLGASVKPLKDPILLFT